MTPVVSLIVGVAIVLAITAGTAWFVAQEFAYVAVDRSKLAARAESGDKAAARTLEITRRTSFLLSGHSGHRHRLLVATWPNISGRRWLHSLPGAVHRRLRRHRCGRPHLLDVGRCCSAVGSQELRDRPLLRDGTLAVGTDLPNLRPLSGVRQGSELLKSIPSSPFDVENAASASDPARWWRRPGSGTSDDLSS